MTVNTLNRIADTGFTYDTPGNLIAEPQKTYNYDAENRMTQSVVGGATVTYVYDGDGKRVKKDQTNGSTYDKLYWYGTGSDPLEESDLSGTASADLIFFNGRRTARLDMPSARVHYYFANHLGSTSVVTSATGIIQDESDYYPFGGEKAVTDTDSNTYKFTGKERDSESGLDFFGARYYSSQYGRFASADAPFSDQDPMDPQSWNLYTYVRNDPMRHVDPDGEGAWDVIKGVVQGGVNFVANTVKGAAYTAYALSPVGQLTGADRELAANVAEGVTTAVNAYKNDGISGTADKVLGQGEQGATAIVTEAVLYGGLAASGRVNSIKPVTGVQANRAAGLAFQDAKAAQTATTDTKVVQDVTVRTQSGVRTQIDVVSTKPGGSIRLQEAKASASARLTPNQAKAHPEIQQSGATVVGKGKPGYPGGTQIPPTTVEVVRPPH